MRARLRLGLVALVVGAIVTGPGDVRAFEPQCPRSIETKQTLAGEVKGWATHLDDPSASGATRTSPTAAIKSGLHQVTFYDGHPSEKASLHPDRTEKNRNVWDFSYDNRPRSYWIGCHYGGTHVTLIAEIPRGVKTCEVRYRDDFTIVERVTCK